MPWATLDGEESYAATVVAEAMRRPDPAIRRALLLEAYLCASGHDRDAVFAVVVDRLSALEVTPAGAAPAQETANAVLRQVEG